MFMQADLVVKIVMIGLLACSILSWMLLIIKLFEFGSLQADLGSLPGSVPRRQVDHRHGPDRRDPRNSPATRWPTWPRRPPPKWSCPVRPACNVAGEHRDSTITRATTAIGAVQASLARRLSGGMQFLASVGANAPFIGLFGTVYGIMNSFIGIANTNTTNLAVVAPGIAQALLATGIGLFAAIPAVVFYNYFQTQITGYGSRSEGFVAELINAISRQLDKGA